MIATDRPIRACVVCESPALRLADAGVLDFEYGAPGAYRYWRCGACGLLNIDPSPTPAALELAYPQTYHAYHPHATRLARYMKKRYWHEKATRLLGCLRGGGSVLDVGCSSGDMLVALAALGVEDATGIDIGGDAVARARARGVNAVHDDFDNCNFGGKRFDVIVMTNFIEHVYQPVKSMQRCHDLLTADGIVIGETPNTDAWDYRLFRRYWGGYHTPRHMYLFNRASLATLAERTGFRMRAMTNMMQPAHWALSVQNRLQASPLGMRLKKGRTPLFTPLLLFAAPFNALQMAVSRTSLVEFVFERARRP